MPRRIAIALALSLAALVGAGSPADAHRGAHSAAERHAKNDLANVSVSVLERRARAKARALGRKPGTRSKRARARARASAVTDPGVVGRWSAVKPVAVVPVAEAMLPNGKILMWDSVGDAPSETYSDHTYTRAAVYDPVTDTSKRVDVKGVNVFCAGFVQLANGNVFVAGGNADKNLSGSRATHTFDWTTETWTRGPDMQDGRWYPSVANSPTDEAVIIGGGPTVAEVRTSTGSLRRLTGVTTASSRLYPFLQTATDGRSMLLGAPPAMSLVDPFGSGTIGGAGTRDAIDRDYGSFAPYDVGRTLVAGGGSVTEDGRSGVPTRTSTAVDTRSGSPVGRATGAMNTRRRQHHLTGLADGSVLATGGQTTNGGQGQVDLANAAYDAERWNPATGSWTTLAPAAVARQYHSTAVLLPDGRVMSGGGGICSACQQVGYFRRDVEIFSPPYLFKRDGSGALAPRPELTGVPGAIRFDAPFTASSPQAGQIRKLGLVRLGAPTHGVDQGQRYVPLSFTASGTTLNVNGPANPNEAPAGYYMLFAVDAAGVPSVASMVSLQRAGASGAAGTNVALRKPVTSTTPCMAEEGPEKAVNGSVTGGNYDKWCSLASNPTLTVDLGASQPIGTFTVRHAGAGGETGFYNTRDFRVETSTDGSTWSTAFTVTGNTANVTTRTVATRQARYVRLAVTHGEQSSSPVPARIYEFEVYGQGAAPVPLTAYSKQNATGGLQRFEAGVFDAVRGNLGQVGNDQIRSLDIAPGFQATICRHAGMVECTTLNAGRHNSLPLAFDRTISSLRVTKLG